MVSLFFQVVRYKLPHWSNYFQVDDCQASEEQAIELGAKSIIPTTPIAAMGFFVYCPIPPGLFSGCSIPSTVNSVRISRDRGYLRSLSYTLFCTIVDRYNIHSRQYIDSEIPHSKGHCHGFNKEETDPVHNLTGGRSCGSDHCLVHVMPVLLALFLLVRLLEFAGHLPLLAASYADDLLCLPLILGGVLWCHRKWGKQSWEFTLPPGHGLMTLVFFAIYFEGILPLWKASAVADPWDLLMYLSGYLIFELLMNKPGREFTQSCCQDFV